MRTILGSVFWLAFFFSITISAQRSTIPEFSEPVNRISAREPFFVVSPELRDTHLTGSPRRVVLDTELELRGLYTRMLAYCMSDPEEYILPDDGSEVTVLYIAAFLRIKSLTAVIRTDRTGRQILMLASPISMIGLLEHLIQRTPSLVARLSDEGLRMLIRWENNITTVRVNQEAEQEIERTLFEHPQVQSGYNAVVRLRNTARLMQARAAAVEALANLTATNSDPDLMELLHMPDFCEASR